MDSIYKVLGTLFLFTFGLMELVSGQVDPFPYRGMYINKFIDYSNPTGPNNILGNSALEDQALLFAKENNIKRIELTHLNDIFPSHLSETNPESGHTWEEDLCNFISRAKNDYCIEQIAAVGASEAFFDDVNQFNTLHLTPPYNLSNSLIPNIGYFSSSLSFVDSAYTVADSSIAFTSEVVKFYLRLLDYYYQNQGNLPPGTIPCKFDIFTTEIEFWNDHDWTNFSTILGAMRTLQLNTSSPFLIHVYTLLRDLTAYGGPPVQGEADFIDLNADRIYLTDYPVSPNSDPYHFWSYSSFVPGIVAFKNSAPSNTIITPLFNNMNNSEGLWNWLNSTTNPENTMYEAEKIFWNDFQANHLSDVGNSIITQGCYQWFKYTEFAQNTSHWSNPYCSDNELFYVINQPLVCDNPNVIQSCTGPVTFTFIGNYEPNILCEWDFGDGSTVLSASPGSQTHYYHVPGTYTVSCHIIYPASTVSSINCDYTFSRIINLTGAGADAGADQLICYGNAVNLNGNISGDATSATWSSSSSGSVGFGNPSSVSTTYTPNATDLAAGIVTLSLTTDDPSGACGSVYDELVVTINPQIIAGVASTPVSCFSGNNGGACVSVSGGTSPYSYLWSCTSQTTDCIVNMPVTNSCSVIVSDINNCSIITPSFNISQPQLLVVSVISVSNISCNGHSDGAITVHASGGTAPYSYFWQPSGGNSATATNLPSGNYTCTVTDAHGCTSSASATISEPAILSVIANQVLPIPCSLSSSSQATSSVSGGVGGYTYVWSPSGGNSQTTPTNLSPGVYTVTCSDANGCGPVSTTVTITEDPLCCGSPSSALTQNYFDTHTTVTGSWSLNSNITLIHDVTLDASTISVGAGYQIFTGDFTLTLKNGSVLESCNLMWKGILVSGEGVVNVLSDSYIKDAQYGIEARQGAMVVSDHGHFINNYIGIYFNPIGSSGSVNVTASIVNSFFDGSSLKTGYPSQLPSPLTHGCAGIYGEGITVLNIGAGGTQNNVFSNLNTGIYTDRTNTNVEKSQFIDIRNYDSYFIPYLDAWGCGIYCHGNGTNLLNELGGNNPGNIDFQNCNVGIRTLSMEAFVIRNQVYNCDIGIEIKQSDNCKITVKENTLDCNLFGIELLFNDYAGIVNVSDNFISVGSRFIINGTSSPHAIGIDLAESRIKNYNRFIRNNEIDLFDYADQGISLNGANGYTIDHNYVYLNNINENIYGIGMAKSDNCTVACNSISGNSQSFTNTSQAAIWIQDCTSNTINCNGMTNTDIGLCFMGTCLGGSGNIIRSNDIGVHETGLLYKGLSTRVDHQDFRGNYWYLNTYSNMAARDENITWAVADKYYVDQNGPRFQNGQSYTNHPQLGEVDPVLFIQDGNSNDEQCGDKIHHSDCIYEPSGGGGETDRRIALNLEGSQQFDEETKWKAKESLYEKILNQPTYLDSDTVFVNFYQSLSGTYLQRIAQINKEKEELYLSQQSLIQVIQSRSENIFLYSAAIRAIDSLLNKGVFSGYQKDSVMNARGSILLNVQQLILLNNASISLLDSSINSDIDILTNENTSINSQNVIEDNEKVVNHAYFDLIIKKRTDLLESYESSLINIASQCPLSGGPAVYTARSLVRLFDPTLRYNDELTCLQSGYSWRKGFDSHPVGVSVSPNPTDNILTVHYNVEDHYTLKLFNAMGVEVLSDEIDAQSNQKVIDTSKYPAGVYFCAMYINESQTSDIERVIILH